MPTSIPNLIWGNEWKRDKEVNIALKGLPSGEWVMAALGYRSEELETIMARAQSVRKTITKFVSDELLKNPTSVSTLTVVEHLPC